MLACRRRIGQDDCRTERRTLVTLVGYARVSTLEQDPALQLDALARGITGYQFVARRSRTGVRCDAREGDAPLRRRIWRAVDLRRGPLCCRRAAECAETLCRVPDQNKPDAGSRNRSLPAPLRG